ncbi:hypothetical protein KAR91_12875 [Candidatus Pacearchaeota archaeon]|nr:hypothetical protein [Candidatus Pacearchaeota archaeon]
MATRKNLNHDAKTRERIQTTQIVKRLMQHVVAKPEIEDGVVIVKDLMTQSQVTAALGLLRKVLPDLTSVAVEAKIETVQRVVSDKPMTIDDWTDEYGDKPRVIEH